MLIDIGRTVGILPYDQQVQGEHYVSGQRFKFQIISVVSFYQKHSGSTEED